MFAVSISIAALLKMALNRKNLEICRYLGL